MRYGRNQPCFSPPRRPVIGILINANIGLNTEFLILSSQSLNCSSVIHIPYSKRVLLLWQQTKRTEKESLKHDRPCGPTDKASDYESGDSRFESWRGRFFFKRFIARDTIFFFKSIITSFPNRLWLDSLRSNDATVARTSLKKWICVPSVLIAIIPPFLLCQM